jgi:hypothetical protein
MVGLKFGSVAVILLSFLGTETLSLAQGSAAETGSSSGGKGKGNKNKDSGHTSKSSGDGEVEPYSYEISSRIIYDMKNGTVKPATDSADTKLSQSEMGGSVMVGSLLSDHIEPFFELSYVSTKRHVSAYSSKDSVMDFGLGVLVNLPQSEKSKGDKDDGVPEIMLAKWIPYIGILVGNSKATNTSGFTDVPGAKVKDSNTYTKFLVGTRWLMFPHISLNFGARILYENSSTSAESSEKTGADRSKLEIELNLLAMSIFI